MSDKIFNFIYMRRYIFAIGLLALGLMTSPALAQEATNTAATTDTVPTVEVTTDSSATVTVTAQPVVGETSTEASVQTTTSVETDDEGPALEGVEVAKPTAVPSNFGLWWRGLRERVSIALTLDPIKKAEKRLVFAEERQKLAEYIATHATDEKVKAKATEMMEKAQEQIAKVEELKDKFKDKIDERAQRLLKNLATHELRREKVLQKLEEKLPEAQEKLDELRAQGLEVGERLLNAINNENLPPAVKERLEAVKIRIASTTEAVKQFRDDRKEIFDKVQSGELDKDAAKEQLKNLQEERKTEMEGIRADFKTSREDLKEAVEVGEVATGTVRKILQLEKKVLKKVEERREKVEELKKKLKPQPLSPKKESELEI